MRFLHAYLNSTRIKLIEYARAVLPRIVQYPHSHINLICLYTFRCEHINMTYFAYLFEQYAYNMYFHVRARCVCSRNALY